MIKFVPNQSFTFLTAGEVGICAEGRGLILNASAAAERLTRHQMTRAEVEANTRLWAGAEKLLDALRLCHELLDNSDVRHFISHDQGEQAKLHAALNAGRAAMRIGGDL